MGSHLMQVLASAREARRDNGSPAVDHGDLLLAERAAAAEALAQAGADDRAGAGARERTAVAIEHTAALDRRRQAEELAAVQARQRADADAAAEEAMSARAHAERMAELALRTRIDEEGQAKINAQRREFAAAELAKAARERARREEELARLAAERLAAERHAADLAAETARAEQVAEAAALAIRAAEQETARELRRRAEQEAAAANAGGARREAELDAAQARQERLAADENLKAILVAADNSVRPDRDLAPRAGGSRPSRQRYPILAALIVGLGGGAWLASSGVLERLGDGAGREKAAVGSLRLDAGTERMAERISRAEALEATRNRR